MDNRINDKDLEFVTGRSAATGNLQSASNMLRLALSLFTDDMPGSVRTRIARTADIIDRGDTDVSYFNRSINIAINELYSFRDTLAGNPDKQCVVDEIIANLDLALMHINS